MKQFLRIFELSKNEQRVVLVVVLILLTIAFFGYERRVHRLQAQPTTAIEGKSSPSPSEMEEH